MEIQKVTLIGADNSVPVDKLIDLSEAFPFVEWGIVFDKAHEDEAGVPSYYWVQNLIDAAKVVAEDKQRIPVNLAAHIRGNWAREMIQQSKPTMMPGSQAEAEQQNSFTLGWFGDRADFVPHFQRIVFDTGSEEVKANPEFFHMLQGYPDVQFVFKGASAADLLADFFAYGLTNGSTIYDADQNWPAPDAGLASFGYTHSELTLGNLAVQLPLIEEAAGDTPFWVELGDTLRSKNGMIFDVEKAREALTIANIAQQQAVIDDEEDEADLPQPEAEPAPAPRGVEQRRFDATGFRFFSHVDGAASIDDLEELQMKDITDGMEIVVMAADGVALPGPMGRGFFIVERGFFDRGDGTVAIEVDTDHMGATQPDMFLQNA